MPKVEKYGAQPPIEILRQMMDQGGWYNLKDPKHPFINIVDTLLVCAMGPPGSGKSFITPRMARHFNTVAFAIFEDSAMKSIFQNILKWFFRVGDFSTEIQGMENKIVDATLNIYKQIQLELKPTPLKSHYTFNLRDFSKIIQGCCLVTKKTLETQDKMIRLWAHETTRVLGDRLIDNDDRTWMLTAIQETVRLSFGQNFDIVFKHLDLDGDSKIDTLDEFRGNLFGDILAAFGLIDRPYEELLEKDKMIKAANEALDRYNDMAET